MLSDMGIRFIIHFEFTLVEFGKIHFIPKICSSMLNFQNILKTNKTSPPSAWEAAMSVMQHGTFFETPLKLLQKPFNLPCNFFETFM